MDEQYLMTPGAEVFQWLEKNGSTLEACGLQSSVLLASPGLFNSFVNRARIWGAEVEKLPVVWEPGADSRVIRAANISVEGSIFTVYRISTASSIAATQFEMLIAAGAKRFLLIGQAEPICSDAKSGDLILASYAIRDEGVSGHYLPGNSPVSADHGMLEEVSDASEELGISIRRSSVWTNDSLFRRSVEKATKLAGRGVYAVETEIASLYAIAEFRAVSIAAVVVLSDDGTPQVDAGIEESCRLAMAVFV